MSAEGLDGVVEPSRDGAVVHVHVHVQPRSGRSELVGRHGDALKVRVADPPVDGRATAATARLLASALGIPPGRVALTGGAHSRIKRFRISGLSAAEVTRRLLAVLDA
ncbi:MAG TPA: DUF167 family protein [Acidimicrobiia bacterium]